MKNHLNEKWYVVGKPWGNGTHLVAGHFDPRIGLSVCACDVYTYHELLRKANGKWDVATPQEIAQRIASDHNEVLALRKRVAFLEKQMTAKQQIDELWGEI